MSQLEMAVRPVLEPMMWGRPTSLGADEQRVLSRWLMKTFYVLDMDPDACYEPISTADERRAFMNGNMSSDFVLEIGRYEGRHMLTKIPFSTSSAPPVYWVLIIGRFFATIQHNGGRPNRFRLAADCHSIEGQTASGLIVSLGRHPYRQTVWPLTTSRLEWPPFQPMTDDGFVEATLPVGAPDDSLGSILERWNEPLAVGAADARQLFAVAENPFLERSPIE